MVNYFFVLRIWPNPESSLQALCHGLRLHFFQKKSDRISGPFLKNFKTEFHFVSGGQGTAYER